LSRGGLPSFPFISLPFLPSLPSPSSILFPFPQHRMETDLLHVTTLIRLTQHTHAPFSKQRLAQMFTKSGRRSDLGFQGHGFKGQGHRDVRRRRHNDRRFAVVDRLVSYTAFQCCKCCWFNFSIYTHRCCF